MAKQQEPTVQHRETTQCLVITYNGEESEKNYTLLLLHVIESCCYTLETNTTL